MSATDAQHRETGRTAGIRVRSAVAGDAPAMADVFTAAVMGRALGHYGPGELRAWAAQGSADRFAAMLADPAKHRLAAEADGRLVGLAGLEGSEVILIYAAPDAPPGTGSRLLTAVETLARQRDIRAVSLIASRNAVSFYLGHGYAIMRLASRPLPGGMSLPVCLMAKPLVSSVHD